VNSTECIRSWTLKIQNERDGHLAMASWRRAWTQKASNGASSWLRSGTTTMIGCSWTRWGLLLRRTISNQFCSRVRRWSEKWCWSSRLFICGGNWRRRFSWFSFKWRCFLF
jgi:hypothetical protein